MGLLCRGQYLGINSFTFCYLKTLIFIPGGAISQNAPEYPNTHEHTLIPFTSSTHVPPFWQEELPLAEQPQNKFNTNMTPILILIIVY